MCNLCSIPYNFPHASLAACRVTAVCEAYNICLPVVFCAGGLSITQVTVVRIDIFPSTVNREVRREAEEQRKILAKKI